MRAIQHRLSTVAALSEQTQAGRRGTQLYRQGQQEGFDRLPTAMLDPAGQWGLICICVCVCLKYRSLSQWFCCLSMHVKMYASVFLHHIITNV